MVSARIKNSIYTLLLLLAIFVVWQYRDTGFEPAQKRQLVGKTMGTTYSIIYFGENRDGLQRGVDSLLVLFNLSLNTWQPESEISQFNSGGKYTFKSRFFYPVLEASQRIFKMTNGAFDPTVMPLVNAWGFGPKKSFDPDSTQIDSIREFVGFEKIQFSLNEVSKSDPRVSLDFSSIAKGYGVDIISSFLNDQGLKNHFVEIGGEVRCVGKNLFSNSDWVIGITDPRSSIEETSIYATLKISNAAIATSGNYYNYRVTDGKKYSHTIDPFSGYPVQREILSATVISSNCMDADALATGFMSAGHQVAIEIAKREPDIEAFIIFTGEDGELKHFISDGIKDKITFIDKEQ